jgi:hypothetical protein
MNVSEFAELVREEGAKSRVTKVTLYAEGLKIRGQGSLLVESERFELQLEVDPKFQTLEPGREVWTHADTWKLSGVIEGRLKFKCNQVSPLGREVSWHYGRRTPCIHKLSLRIIDLVPTGFDALTRAQRDKITGRTPSPKPRYPKVEFHAVLLKCEPVFLNAGTRTDTRNDFLGKCGGG